MKTLTTFLIVLLSCSFASVGTQTFAQDTGDDSANVESDQLEATIVQLREQLMKLESERAEEAAPVSIVGGFANDETASLSSIRSGKGAFGVSQMVDAVPAQLSTQGYTLQSQYQQAIPMATVPTSSTWQPMPTQYMPVQSVPMAIAAPVQPVYAAPAIDYSQPAPIVQQPLVVEQAPAPQTIIVNIYQQAPAAQNNFSPPILAPIYGPAPIQVSSPRRGCCLFGRR